MGNYLIYGLIFTMLGRLTNMKTYKVELIVKIQEDSYPDKWLADAVYELLEPENGEDIIKYRVTELESEVNHD
jgi:hypothetical protein